MVGGRGVRTADADIRGPGSADFLGSKATTIVYKTNLEWKCQCTSSQQFENWSIFGQYSRLCKKACLTVWGPRHCVQCSVIRSYLRMRTVRRHESPLQLRLMLADADYPRTWNLRIRSDWWHFFSGFCYLNSQQMKFILNLTSYRNYTEMRNEHNEYKHVWYFHKSPNMLS